MTTRHALCLLVAVAPTPTRSQAEIAEFERFAKQDRVHEVLFAQIAPNIFGSEEIKKAVACLLFGGSRKVRPAWWCWCAAVDAYLCFWLLI